MAQFGQRGVNIFQKCPKGPRGGGGSILIGTLSQIISIFYFDASPNHSWRISRWTPISLISVHPGHYLDIFWTASRYHVHFLNHLPLSETRHRSATECPFDLKPGCKFKFVHCLETYLRKFISSAMMGHCRVLFYHGSPEVSIAWYILGSIWGSVKVQEGPLSLGRVGQWPNKWSNMVRGARECKI